MDFDDSFFEDHEDGERWRERRETTGGNHRYAAKMCTREVQLLDTLNEAISLCVGAECFHFRTHAHTHAHARTHTHTHTHAHPRTHTHAHAHAHAHPRKHTHAHNTQWFNAVNPDSCKEGAHVVLKYRADFCYHQGQLQKAAHIYLQVLEVV